MRRSLQRIRYPPFELGQMHPSAVPISEVEVEVDDDMVTNFRIGSEESWFVEWADCNEDDPPGKKFECEIGFEPPIFLTRNRLGWFINPDPLHNISRRLIMPTVLLLIVSLFIHAIEPGLVDLGIISSAIAGSVIIGPLEYPRLLFYTFPLFLLPLIFRTIANFRDMARQSMINKKPYQEPTFTIDLDRGSPIVTIHGVDSDISLIRARIQVGVASPERSTVLYSLGRNQFGQPSPGMSTELSEKRVSPGDEVGSGVGESTPMQSTTKKSVILEPLRIMSRGKWVSEIVVGLPCKLCMPDEKWPGSIYSSLIAIHWEVIIEFEQNDGRRIAWVSPISVPQSDVVTDIPIAPVISGRAELSDLL